MITNYNLECDYHNFELKDKIYLIPDYALKVIYTDGFNEVVFSGNTTNMTILEGHDISFQEESNFDERFMFSKTLSIKVEGYVTFSDLYNRYMAIIETKEGEFYLVNVDFPSYVTHTYTLNNGTNETELVFSSQSNIATLKLANFNPNNINSCKEYSIPKIKNVKLTEAWASYLSTWQKSLVNKGSFVDIESLPDSVNLTEEFDGEKYTVTLGFDIPMNYYKNDWHIKLLQFTENKYRGFITLEDGNTAFVGYNVGLFPSYTINGDIISIRLTENSIRGIAYGDDYAFVDTNMPNNIEFNGASCYTYNWNSTCDWNVVSKPEYITITPMSGNANTQYALQVCNTDDETGYAVSEFAISACNSMIKPQVIVENPIYRYIPTSATTCIEMFDGKYKFTLDDSSTVTAACVYNPETIRTGDTNSYKNNLISAEIGQCVEIIEGEAFKEFSGLTSIDIPDNVDTIGHYAFQGCISLTGITLPNSLTSIGHYEFQGCTSLSSVTIPNGVIDISNSAFKDCTSLTGITIPNSVTSISGYAFTNCSSLSSATIGSGVTAIGTEAFKGCTSLTGITMPNNVTSIATGTFSGCTSLENAVIGNDLPNINQNVFYGCTSLTSITIGSGVTSIGEGAFEGCSGLANITLSSGLTSIGVSAFRNCSGLTSITIPSGVTSIGNYAFYYCSSLASITVEATTPPTLGTYSPFEYTNLNAIYVPSESVDIYKNATKWKQYKDIIQPIP